MTDLESNNQRIWEERYRDDRRVAKWPFDLVVSMVMRRFANAPDRSAVRILDYGCGGGNNFWFLAREGFAAYAGDVAQSALDMTRRRMAGEGLDLPADRFALFNGPRLPFPDGQFDAIIDRESLCQSGWAEIRERVAEFRRVLKPGGWYLGINFTDHHPDARHATCLGNGDWHEFRQGLFKGQGRRHLFSINDLSELFADWRIDHVLHHSVTAVLGSREEVSEYVIAAQTPGAPTP